MGPKQTNRTILHGQCGYKMGQHNEIAKDDSAMNIKI